MSELLHPRWTCAPSEIGGNIVGGKAASLARLSPAGFPVPEWFVVLPSAFDASAVSKDPLPSPGPRQADKLHTLAGAGVPKLPFTAILDELEHRLARFPEGTLFAVRSSAADEDGAEHSFAGQLDSFLFVTAADVPRKIVQVWSSGFGEHVLAYRKERGLAELPGAPAVIVQQMVPAEKAGVAFSADPVSGRRSVTLVSGVWGLGSGLVSGECDADTWQVHQGQILSAVITQKRTAHRMAPGRDDVTSAGTSDSDEGVASQPVQESLMSQPCLADAEVCEVAQLVQKVALHFQRAQDIEWAYAAGKLYLLQARPITSLFHQADPDGMLTLWDNSNIAESYNGVTTPLTFSFARMAYAAVYEEFCRLMSVPEERVQSSRVVFRRMLGYLQGRIYYNLVNWYRVLALLPGFQVNRRFMEQMMGVKEELPAEILQEFESKPDFREKMQDGLALTRTIIGLLWNFLRVESQIEKFYLRLNWALERKRPLSELRLDELSQEFTRLEQQLLTRWDAPLVNDFLAMISFGVLRSLSKKWLGESDLLANDLLSGEGGIISMEPARLVRQLADEARRHPVLVASLCEDELPTIRKVIAEHATFARHVEAYLNQFGQRCLEELKLETITLEENPLPLLRSIGHSARRAGAANAAHDTKLRDHAETRVAEKLAARPLKRWVFNWVLRQARSRVKARENLRFERTRVFGKVRKIFVEMGQRLAGENRLDQPRDIFFLTLEELLGIVDGTVVSTEWKKLVAIRKAEAEVWKKATPSDRFETRGAVHIGNRFIQKPSASMTNLDAASRQGIGCCPGIIRGRARVILHPENAEILPGEILVAPRTDPGWILLFPSASGLLVEHGSLLSHSAIVAREMRLPAVVSVPGLTTWLQTGDEVEFDGSTGIIRRLEGKQ